MSKISEFSDDSLRTIAREVVEKRFALIVHFWAYAFVNILLFIINYVADYSIKWHYWVLTGWGIGLGIHACIYLFYKKGIVNVSTLFLLYHIALYLLVNAFLFFIAWFTNDGPKAVASWVWYPLGFWGLGLAFHLIMYFYLMPKNVQGKTKSYIDRKVEEELQKLKNKK